MTSPDLNVNYSCLRQVFLPSPSGFENSIVDDTIIQNTILMCSIVFVKRLNEKYPLR